MKKIGGCAKPSRTMILNLPLIIPCKINFSFEIFNMYYLFIEKG